MKKYRCIIIEDEPLAMERTASYVKKIPFLELVGKFDNAMSGLAFLTSNDIEILFLDINMDELSGIELLESTTIKPEVIITTAYQQYALKGYELDVTDYLLKPFTFQRFLKAVTKVHKKLEKKNVAQEYIFIKSESKLIKVFYDDILFIEGMRDYRRIFLKEGKSIMTLQKFSDLEQLLPTEIICRVHKSYMISINKIREIEKNSIRINNKTIPVSATYKSAFYARLKK